MNPEDQDPGDAAHDGPPESPSNGGGSEGVSKPLEPAGTASPSDETSVYDDPYHDESDHLYDDPHVHPPETGDAAGSSDPPKSPGAASGESVPPTPPTSDDDDEDDVSRNAQVPCPFASASALAIMLGLGFLPVPVSARSERL